jgi:hypothetical protein
LNAESKIQTRRGTAAQSPPIIKKGCCFHETPFRSSGKQQPYIVHNGKPFGFAKYFSIQKSPAKTATQKLPFAGLAGRITFRLLQTRYG